MIRKCLQNLFYDVDSERLIVTLQRMRNLPGRAQRSSLSLSGNSSCDPFARVYLLPDEKRYLQTTMKVSTIDGLLFDDSQIDCVSN